MLSLPEKQGIQRSKAEMQNKLKNLYLLMSDINFHPAAGKHSLG